jgi:hypothetical protein
MHLIDKLFLNKMLQKYENIPKAVKVMLKSFLWDIVYKLYILMATGHTQKILKGKTTVKRIFNHSA